jgi:hypothetical protein
MRREINRRYVLDKDDLKEVVIFWLREKHDRPISDDASIEVKENDSVVNVSDVTVEYSEVINDD